MAKSTHISYLSLLFLLTALLVWQTVNRTVDRALPPNATTLDDETQVQLAFAGLNHPQAADHINSTALALQDSSPQRTNPRSNAAAPAKQAPKSNAGAAKSSASSTALSDELALQCIGVAREIDGELGARLATLHERNPDAFNRVIRNGEQGSKLLALVQLKQRDPDVYRAKLSEFNQALQVNRMLTQYRDALKAGNAAQIDAIKEQLKTSLQIQLAIEIKARGEVICGIEDKVEKARQELEHDVRHFHETVEGRLQAYLQSIASQQADPNNDDALDQLDLISAPQS